MDFDLLRFPEMAMAVALRPVDACGVGVPHECRNTFTPGPPHRLENYLVVIYDCPSFRDRLRCSFLFGPFPLSAPLLFDPVLE
jgi:hypothetical protein